MNRAVWCNSVPIRADLIIKLPISEADIKQVDA